MSWNLEGVVWRCCARVPDVLGSFLKFLTKLSLRVRAIISALNETVFALIFLETGGVARADSCEKWSTPSCAWTLCDHLMCEELLFERSAVRTLAERRNYQIALGSFLEFVHKRTILLVADVEIDGALVAYSNDCFLQGVQHHHGSQLLAPVMGRWPSFSRFGSRKLARFH